MFVPSSRPFSEIAGDLYLPSSFEAPSPALHMPAGDPEWRYYGPENGQPAPPFHEFMRTPAFFCIQRQFLEGVAHCEAFADQYFSAQEAKKCRAGFQTFRDRLLLEDGLRMMGVDRLPVLYGIGKQSFDSFCMLLDHPGIELHLRKSALRELASQVRTCMGTGPAFTHALTQLWRPDGTLRGQYWLALQQMMDESVRQFVRGEDGAAAAAMETHRVNRFRLELGLPGALRNDTLSEGASLAMPQEVSACAESLLRGCRPADVALVLASRYREQLVGRTAEGLGVSPSEVDPANELHMNLLREVERSLAPTFSGTSLRSLIEEDLMTDLFRWRRDDSLVALDLLQELASQGLIRPPVVKTLHRGSSADGSWAVRHVDERLIYLQEYLRGSGGRGVLGSVGMEQLRHMLPLRQHLAHQRLVSTVLEAESPQALMSFPLRALSSEAQAAQLLRRLGRKHSLTWVRDQSLTNVGLDHLLVSATNEGHGALLKDIFARQLGRRPMAFIALAGGPGVLRQAFQQGDEQTGAAWVEMCRRALPEMDPSTLAAALTHASGGPLVWNAVMRGAPLALDALLGLIEEARAQGKLSHQGFLRHLLMPVQRAMQAGREASLGVLTRCAMRAARNRWLGPEELQVALEGSTMGGGCMGSVTAGRVAGVKQFQSAVLEAAKAGYLSSRQVAMMLCGVNAKVSAQMEAAARRDPLMLTAVLEGVTEVARRGWIASPLLGACLSLRDDGDTIGGLARILTMRDGQCARAWTAALITMHREGFLKADQIADLVRTPVVTHPQLMLTARNPVNVPLPVFVAGGGLWETSQGFLGRETALTHWGDCVAALYQADALTWMDLMEILFARHGAQPALGLAMEQADGAPMVTALVRVYGALRAQGVISETEFVALLAVWSGPSEVPSRPHDDAASAFVQCLLQEVRDQHLSPASCTPLITPYLQRESVTLQEARDHATQLVHDLK